MFNVVCIRFSKSLQLFYFPKVCLYDISIKIYLIHSIGHYFLFLYTSSMKCAEKLVGLFLFFGGLRFFTLHFSLDDEKQPSIKDVLAIEQTSVHISTLKCLVHRFGIINSIINNEGTSKKKWAKCD